MPKKGERGGHNPGAFKPGFDERRHSLSKEECRKGYAILQMKVQLGQIPSRLSCSVRKKIRRFYNGG